MNNSGEHSQLYLNRYHHWLRNYWLREQVTSGNILDVGCGVGVLLSDIHRHKANVELYGLDINLRYLAEARRIVPEARLINASIYQIPFPDGFFDTVICAEVLEHLLDPMKALSELKRVCKTYLVISVPTYRSLLCVKRYYRNVEHIQDYTKARIVQELTAHHLSVESVIASRLILIPAPIAAYIRPILFAIDKNLGFRKLFNNFGFHTIVKARKD
jgi:ubiquinone/menaquinone biosynthesis C-methylase UbiE